MQDVAEYAVNLVDPKQVAKGWRRCFGCGHAKGHLWNLHTKHHKLYQALMPRPGAPLSLADCPAVPSK